MVVPEPGPAGGEKGAPLAPTLEHLRAPVVGSNVGPEHRLPVLLQPDPDTNFHVDADLDLDPDHHDADLHVRKYNSFLFNF